MYGLPELIVENALSLLSAESIRSKSIKCSRDFISILCEKRVNSEKEDDHIKIKIAILFEHALLSNYWLYLIERAILVLYLLRFELMKKLKAQDNPIIARILLDVLKNGKISLRARQAIVCIMSDTDPFADQSITLIGYCGANYEFDKAFLDEFDCERLRSVANKRFEPFTGAARSCLTLNLQRSDESFLLGRFINLVANNGHAKTLSYFKRIACGNNAPLFSKFEVNPPIILPDKLPITIEQLPILYPKRQIGMIWHDGLCDEFRMKHFDRIKKKLHLATLRTLNLDELDSLLGEQFVGLEATKYSFNYPLDDLKVYLRRDKYQRLLFRKPILLEKVGIDLETAKKLLLTNLTLISAIFLICIEFKYDIKSFFLKLCCGEQLTLESLELIGSIHEGANIPRQLKELFIRNAVEKLMNFSEQSNANERFNQEQIVEAFLNIATMFIQADSRCAASEDVQENLSTLALNYRHSKQATELFKSIQAVNSSTNSRNTDQRCRCAEFLHAPSSNEPETLNT